MFRAGVTYHARLMNARWFVVPIVVVAALSSACTGNDADESATIGPRSTTPIAPTSVPPGTGVYVYQNAGLVATLELRGSAGTLRIDNETGRELPAATFYLLDARDGRRVDGSVESPAATPDGSTSEFAVRFSGLEVRNIGLAVLLIGPDNYGAFVRQ
jgi:hypothetical protein